MTDQHYLTVSQLSLKIQQTIQSQFTDFFLKGEISGLKVHSSGHAYFTLKDDKCVIDAIMWRGSLQSAAHKPEEGLEVVARCRVTTYPARSKYQVVVSHFTPAGVGALLKVFEERKRKLRQEGLFSEDQKKQLPAFPERIAILTSETGAVIQDMTSRLLERLPITVELYPVVVQGNDSVASILKALNALENKDKKPDIIVIARGGGSLEDLWGFNDEVLVRRIADAKTPVVSAIGHETDVTLLDYVADVRAPTPTAAIEIILPLKRDLRLKLSHFQEKLQSRLNQQLNSLSYRLSATDYFLKDPHRSTERASQALDDNTIYLERAYKAVLQQKSAKVRDIAFRLLSPQQVAQNAFLNLSALTRSLKAASPHSQIKVHKADLNRQLGRLRYSYLQQFLALKKKLLYLDSLLMSLSYKETLKRGFTVITNDNEAGSPLCSSKEVKVGQKLRIQFYDGFKKATIDS